MSRAFVKETDREELPLVPPRAHLPKGTPNYVTPYGLSNLKTEMQNLQANKAQVLLQKTAEDDKRIELYVLNEKIRMLQDRIGSAQVLDMVEENKTEVHFGARVKLYNEDKKYSQTFKIVGVDEAKISEAKIAFISPLAKALSGKKNNESIAVQLPIGLQHFTILSISYEE